MDVLQKVKFECKTTTLDKIALQKKILGLLALQRLIET